MNLRRLLATTGRVLAQLLNDKRSIALILWVPIMLELLLRFIYDHHISEFNRVGAPMLGIFPLVMMFVVASVATLRERTRGTMERLLVMPINKGEFVLGYALAFAVIAVVQAVLVSLVTLWLLDLQVSGDKLLVIIISILNGLLGLALGLFSSAYAKTEFHVVQFLPALIMPQFMLCGLLLPRADMQTALRLVSDVMPLSYVVDAMQIVASKSTIAGTHFIRDVIIVAIFVIGSLILGALSIRRQTT